MRKENHWVVFSVVGIFVLGPFLGGCGQQKENKKSTETVARPVFARSIGSFQPSQNDWITGSVAAWKTEKVGFEVNGRIQSVVEPDQKIEGRVLANNMLLSPGTPLARLNSQRYQIAVEKAKSSVTVATRKRESLAVQIDEAQKASLKSALAKQKLAEVEFQRAKQLYEQNASSRSQFDQAKADYESALATTENTRAQIKGSRADLSSLDAEIEQAKQNLEIAKLDLKDTVLYSEFRGVVSQTHVVPGSLVRAGDPVVTIQMMDPMKIEFEVSAKLAKSYRKGDTVKLFSDQSSTDEKPLTGFVYTTDPIADPKTRTFTVTLLARNPATNLPVPDQLKGQTVARTEEVWPINIDSIIGAHKGLMVEQSAIHQDNQGYYLLRAKNRSTDTAASNRLIEVEKIRVQAGPQRVPFFNWVFQPIKLMNPDKVNPKKDLFVGAISFDQGNAASWDGKHVIFDQINWKLLPGDVVKISLNKEDTSGTYVPFGSIRKKDGQTYIFVASYGGGSSTTVQKIAVNVLGSGFQSSSGEALCKVEVVDKEETIPPTAMLITEGVHYLQDGETIKVINQQLGEIQ